MTDQTEMCPTCGFPLNDPEETRTGKKLQRCSQGKWNSETKSVDGCDYVKWLTEEPKQLDEKCPQCGEPLVLQTTRTGKKMKKCSTGGWDKDNRVATGCTYVEWINGTKEELKEECKLCGAPLVLMTTPRGKKMKKCSTAGWNAEFRQATGCTYVEWLA